jgi:serine/threonine protein kinase
VIVLPTGAHLHIVRMLGSGGCGEAWLVHVGEDDAEAVLKIPRRDAPDGAARSARLRQEAEVLARIDHCGVPRLLATGIHDGAPYILLDRIEGTCSTALLRERLPLPIIIALAADLAATIASLHADGITHSDIKPENIIIGRIADRGDALRPRLIDFGLARTEETDVTRLTCAGQTLGTHGFLDPATIGRGELRDSASDVFGLGATIASWALGRRLFAPDDWWAIVRERMAAQRGEADLATVDHAVDAMVAQRLAPLPHARLRQLMTAMLRAQPHLRPDAAQAAHLLKAMTTVRLPRAPQGTDTEATMRLLIDASSSSLRVRLRIAGVTLAAVGAVAAALLSAQSRDDASSIRPVDAPASSILPSAIGLTTDENSIICTLDGETLFVMKRDTSHVLRARKEGGEVWMAPVPFDRVCRLVERTQTGLSAGLPKREYPAYAFLLRNTAEGSTLLSLPRACVLADGALCTAVPRDALAGENASAIRDFLAKWPTEHAIGAHVQSAPGDDTPSSRLRDRASDYLRTLHAAAGMR